MKMSTFNFLGTVDVTATKDLLAANELDWDNEYTETRNATFKEHKSVEVIPLMWSRENLLQSPEVQAPRTRFFDKYYNYSFFTELEILFENYYGRGYFIRIMLLKLLPWSEITPHRDGSISLLVNRRTHIPIKTNDNVIFRVGSDALNLKQGEIWEINNSEIHSVKNQSSEDRVHLVVDWHVL